MPGRGRGVLAAGRLWACSLLSQGCFVLPVPIQLGRCLGRAAGQKGGIRSHTVHRLRARRREQGSARLRRAGFYPSLFVSSKKGFFVVGGWLAAGPPSFAGKPGKKKNVTCWRLPGRSPHSFEPPPPLMQTEHHPTTYSPNTTPPPTHHRHPPALAGRKLLDEGEGGDDGGTAPKALNVPVLDGLPYVYNGQTADVFEELIPFVESMQTNEPLMEAVQVCADTIGIPFVAAIYAHVFFDAASAFKVRGTRACGWR